MAFSGATPDNPGTSTASEPASRSATPDRACLLVVDDERGPRESLRMILSGDHDVLVAEDGAEALGLLDQHPVDAITVDLNMPGMKGDELMRQVRSEHPQVEVIIITGYSSVETAVDGLRHGIFDYLTKPFDVARVSQTVRGALARRASRARLMELLYGGDETSAPAADHEAGGDHAARLLAAIQGSSRRRGDGDRPDDAKLEDLVERIASAVESREPDRVGHARRVAFLSGLIAEWIGLDGGARERIRVAAWLHDLGRVALTPDPGKSNNVPIDPDLHAAAGADLARSLGYSVDVADTLRHHHARWDGPLHHGPANRSTPTRDEIPLAARIVAVADAFDGLTRDGIGTDPASTREAIEALRDRAGHELDPDLVKAMTSIAESGVEDGGPLLGLCALGGDDPADTIATATARLENDQ